MLEIFLTTAATLAIALYLQARNCARIIRRNRTNEGLSTQRFLLHPPKR